MLASTKYSFLSTVLMFSVIFTAQALQAEETVPDTTVVTEQIAAVEKKETQDTELNGATGFVFPTGFYVSADPLGGFVRLGGYGDGGTANSGCFRCSPLLTSRLQPWVAINVGYDITPNYGVEMTLGTGFVSASAPKGYSFIDGTPDPSGIDLLKLVPENSAMTMVNLAATGSWYFYDRLAVQGKAFVGGMFINPDPNPARLNLIRSLNCDSGSWGDPTNPADKCGGEFSGDFGALVGAGIGLRYATLLPGIIIGLDVNAYLAWTMNAETRHTGGYLIKGDTPTYIPPPVDLGSALPIIPAISVTPVIKYVF